MGSEDVWWDILDIRNGTVSRWCIYHSDNTRSSYSPHEARTACETRCLSRLAWMIVWFTTRGYSRMCTAWTPRRDWIHLEELETLAYLRMIRECCDIYPFFYSSRCPEGSGNMPRSRREDRTLLDFIRWVSPPFEWCAFPSSLVTHPDSLWGTDRSIEKRRTQKDLLWFGIMILYISTILHHALSLRRRMMWLSYPNETSVPKSSQTPGRVFPFFMSVYFPVFFSFFTKR